MTRTRVPEVIRRTRCEETCGVRQVRRPAHEEAARLPGGGEPTFRRYIERCEDEGFDARVDKRMYWLSAHRAPVDEGVRSDPRSCRDALFPIRNPLRNPHVPGTISYT